MEKYSIAECCVRSNACYGVPPIYETQCSRVYTQKVSSPRNGIILIPFCVSVPDAWQVFLLMNRLTAWFLYVLFLSTMTQPSSGARPVNTDTELNPKRHMPGGRGTEGGAVATHWPHGLHLNELWGLANPSSPPIISNPVYLLFLWTHSHFLSPWKCPLLLKKIHVEEKSIRCLLHIILRSRF